MQSDDPEIRYSKKLVLFDRIYKDEKKFGKTNDSFDYKLLLFYDKCKRVGLSKHAYIYEASIMLIWQIQSWFYKIRNMILIFDEFCEGMRDYFEKDEWEHHNLNKWHMIIFADVIKINLILSTTKCFRKLCDEFNILQKNINSEFHKSKHFREIIVWTCRKHFAFIAVLIRSSDRPFVLVKNLYVSIISHKAIQKSSNVYTQHENDRPESFYIDRQYHRDGSNFRSESNSRKNTFQSRKKCFVCDKKRCWSTKHTEHERNEMKKRFNSRMSKYKNHSGYDRWLHQYIIEYEGIEDIVEDNENDDEFNQFFDDLALEAKFAENEVTSAIKTINPDLIDMFFTSFGDLQNTEPLTVTNLLADKTFKHRITCKNEVTAAFVAFTTYSFNATTSSRYDESEFKDLLIDSDVVMRFTNGIGQLKTLQNINKTVKIDTSTAGSASFIFGIGSTSSINTINLNTPLGMIVFHIVQINTPFLLCFADMDKLGAFFNNIANQLVQSNRFHPVIRRYGHAFLAWYISAFNITTESLDHNPCFLTDVELRRLHRRFGHSSVRRLQHVLERFGHEFEIKALKHFIKYCEHCQKHEKSFGRFSFIIKNDVDFNYNIIVNILYINSKSILHIVDNAIRFQIGRWLKEVFAKHVWNQLRYCWIDTYFGLFDFIFMNAGKQFAAKEFKQYAANMRIIVKNVSVKAHHSIGLIERYHGPLRRIYTIIIIEIFGINADLVLQMSFKTFNDSVEPNGLVFTLLVFKAYSRMTDMNASSFTLTQRAIAMRKTMDEMRKIHANRQINDVLNIRNGPNSTLIHGLPFNSLVLVYRESKTDRSGTWKKPHKLLDVQGETVILKLSSGLTKFRTTSVKPYYQTDLNDDQNYSENAAPNSTNTAPAGDLADDKNSGSENTVHNGPENIDENTPAARVKYGRGRTVKYSTRINQTAPDVCFVLDGISTFQSSPQFQASRLKEITGLLEKKVFEIIHRKNISANARIFNSWFVDEIKHSGIDKAFEKSRLVIQTYNNIKKDLVLTQTFTIQRISQRLVVCLAAVL